MRITGIVGFGVDAHDARRNPSQVLAARPLMRLGMSARELERSALGLADRTLAEQRGTAVFPRGCGNRQSIGVVG
jgi:hypothetical protein